MPKPYRLGEAQPTSNRFSGKRWCRGSAFFVTLQRSRTHVWEGCRRASASVLDGVLCLPRTPCFFCSVHALNAFQQCVVSVFERLGNDAPREVAVLQLDLREHRSSKSCCGPDQFLFHVRPSREWLCRNSHSAPGGGGHPSQGSRPCIGHTAGAPMSRQQHRGSRTAGWSACTQPSTSVLPVLVWALESLLLCNQHASALDRRICLRNLLRQLHQVPRSHIVMNAGGDEVHGS